MSVVIRSKYGKLILDIHYGEGKRTRPSTGLDDTKSNRTLLEDNVVPKIKVEIAEGKYLPKNHFIAMITLQKALKHF